MSDLPLRERLRPPDVPAGQIAACLGLISDTHYGDRLDVLPAAVLEIFRGVDLILHAGDVGLLSVLDELSKAAPVVAVHGNDERFPEAQRELPYQQVVHVAGQRILLTHAHYPDLTQEMESRKNDAWPPKLERRATMGQSAGAQIVVYGHTHIPTDIEHDGVRLVNPGALASGNFQMRQHRKTVALLYVHADGGSSVVHVDLAEPDRPLAFEIDWPAGFRVAVQQFQEPILATDADDAYRRLRDAARALGSEVFESVREAVRMQCMKCWNGQQDVLTMPDLAHAIETAPDVTPEARTELLAALSGASSEA